jgi:uncharacterized short protein YbdD (DUF466 family)
MSRLLLTTWNGLRALCGDDAYERYLDHARLHHPSEEPLSRKAFYERQQRDKWQSVSRCC